MNAAQVAPAGALRTGGFGDGPFVGLHYRTPSREGLTDKKGHFPYKAGEAVTFFIGSLSLGTTHAAPRLTLADLRDRDGAGGPSFTLSATVNRERFVQSLGREADLRSGVVLAAQSIDDGKALGALDRLIAITNEPAPPPAAIG